MTNAEREKKIVEEHKQRVILTQKRAEAASRGQTGRQMVRGTNKTDSLTRRRRRSRVGGYRIPRSEPFFPCVRGDKTLPINDGNLGQLRAVRKGGRGGAAASAPERYIAHCNSLNDRNISALVTRLSPISASESFSSVLCFLRPEVPDKKEKRTIEK